MKIVQYVCEVIIGIEISCLSASKTVNKIQIYSMNILFRSTRRQLLSYRFCTDNKKPALEKAPSLVNEIFQTVRESAVDSVSKMGSNLRQSAHNFKKEANSNSETSAAKTVYNMAKLAWRRTFPSHDDEVRARMETMKAKVAERKKEEEQFKQYTEEELAQMQDKIPEWKRTSLQAMGEATSERDSLRKKIQQKIASRLKQTEYSKRIQESEEYKEYSTFKSEMKQFKEDLTEKIQNHPSNFVQVSLYAAKAVTKESEVAKAIRQMRMIDPDFDLFELEKEAKVIFENTYNLYLRGELDQLQKVCGEMALGYFKVLLKKQEADKSEPKHKQLWNVDEIRFTRASVPEATKMPVFVFTIKTQEIFCLVSKSDRAKIIDGDDERILSMDYMFALTPHSNPAGDEFGHYWEMIEIQPQQVVKMLV